MKILGVTVREVPTPVIITIQYDPADPEVIGTLEERAEECGRALHSAYGKVKANLKAGSVTLTLERNFPFRKDAYSAASKNIYQTPSNLADNDYIKELINNHFPGFVKHIDLCTVYGGNWWEGGKRFTFDALASKPLDKKELFKTVFNVSHEEGMNRLVEGIKGQSGSSARKHIGKQIILAIEDGTFPYRNMLGHSDSSWDTSEMISAYFSEKSHTDIHKSPEFIEIEKKLIRWSQREKVCQKFIEVQRLKKDAQLIAFMTALAELSGVELFNWKLNPLHATLHELNSNANMQLTFNQYYAPSTPDPNKAVHLLYTEQGIVLLPVTGAQPLRNVRAEEKEEIEAAIRASLQIVSDSSSTSRISAQIFSAKSMPSRGTSADAAEVKKTPNPFDDEWSLWGERDSVANTVSSVATVGGEASLVPLSVAANPDARKKDGPGF